MTINAPPPAPTEPSAEALLEDATLAAMVEVERLGRHYSDAEGALVLEIRTGRLRTIIRSALDRFAAARVREERERRRNGPEARIGWGSGVIYDR